jgi:activating signal cointegrator 1
VTKIITLWQPWATLIALGLKTYETRHWRTYYTGLIVIHAAKRKMDRDGLKLLQTLQDGFELPSAEAIPYGQIVAVALLKNCHKIGQETYFDLSGRHINPKDVSPIERLCGNWGQGRFAWELSNVLATEPFPYKGSQGLVDIGVDTLARLILK